MNTFLSNITNEGRLLSITACSQQPKLQVDFGGPLLFHLPHYVFAFVLLVYRRHYFHSKILVGGGADI